MKTFPEWFKKVKFRKTAYFARELKPLLERCWNDAKPKKKMTRSLAQNRYLFGVVYKEIAEYTGYKTPEWNEELNWIIGLDNNEVHSEMGNLFLSYEKNGRTYIFSTTKLNTAEMEEYLKNVRDWASQELGLYIKLPNESDCPY